MVEFTTIITNDCGLKKRPITARNPKANSIIERIHHIVGNMIKSFEAHNIEIGEKDLWPRILSAVRFATRVMVPTIMQVTPMQIVVGREVILIVHHETNWKFLKERKN
eukprot:9427674-Ditylum_brightwellii.AAC.1